MGHRSAFIAGRQVFGVGVAGKNPNVAIILDSVWPPIIGSYSTIWSIMCSHSPLEKRSWQVLRILLLEPDFLSTSLQFSILCLLFML